MQQDKLILIGLFPVGNTIIAIGEHEVGSDYEDHFMNSQAENFDEQGRIIRGTDFTTTTIRTSESMH